MVGIVGLPFVVWRWWNTASWLIDETDCASRVFQHHCCLAGRLLQPEGISWVAIKKAFYDTKKQLN